MALLIFSGCSGTGEKENLTAGFTATFEKVYETTGEENSEDGWLVRPGNMAVDHNDYLYVTDEDRNFIQKFDAELNFIQKIGGQGRGPGEFDQISSLFADSVLFGLSRGNQTMNKFNLEGDFISSYPIQGMIGQTDIIRVEDGFILSHMTFSRNLDDFYGIHFYNNRFEKRGDSQLHASEIYPDFNEDLSYQVMPTYSNIFFTGDQKFIISPRTYSGVIYEYILNSDNQVWEKNKTIKATEIEEAYSRLSGRENADMLFFMAGTDEPSAFRIHGESLFFSQLENGQFVHFIKRDIGEERQYGIELFDENMNYLGFDAFLTDPNSYDEDRILFYSPKAKNSKDLFYSIEYGEEGPKLTARALEIEMH